MTKNWFPLLFSRLGSRNRGNCYLIESVWFLKRPEKPTAPEQERRGPALDEPPAATLDAMGASELAANQASSHLQG